MKILFTADLHIKLGQKNVPVDWATNRYSMLIDELARLQSQADIVVLGGDIFDKLPNMEELDIYYKLLSVFNKPTYIIDGNHEASKRGKTFFSYLKYVSARVNSRVTIVDDYAQLHGIDFIPYCRLKDFEKNPFTANNPVLVTHVRGAIEPHVKPEVDLDLFSSWGVVLAGDLHSYENCQLNILYPGSPVTTSFHRSLVDTGVIILDTDTLKHDFIKLDMPQLIKKTVTPGELIVPTEFHHTVYDIEGDLAELSNIEDNSLLDKKIVKRNTETSLILDPTMSVPMEVKEYLAFILELNDEAIEAALQEYHYYAHKFS